MTIYGFDIYTIQVVVCAVIIFILGMIVSSKRRKGKERVLHVSDDAGVTYHKIDVHAFDKEGLNVITNALDRNYDRWLLFDGNGKKVGSCETHSGILKIMGLEAS